MFFTQNISPKILPRISAETCFDDRHFLNGILDVMFHFVGHRRAFRLNAATGVVGVGIEPAHQPEDQVSML